MNLTLRLLPLLPLAAIFAIYCWSGILRCAYPFGLENGEGLVLRFSQLLAGGKQLYTPLNSGPPFVGCNYPPFFLLLVSWIIQFTGAGFFPGRLISFLSTLGIAAAILRMARLAGADWISAALGALIFFSIPLVNSLTVLGRVDMLAVFLGAMGIALLLPGVKNDQKDAGDPRASDPLTLGEIGGMILLALGTFTKQTGAFAPFAYCVWALMRRRRRIPRTLALLGGACLLPHGITWFVSRGEYFRWVAGYSSGQYTFDQLQYFLRLYIAQGWIVALPAFGLVFAWAAQGFSPRAVSAPPADGAAPEPAANLISRTPDSHALLLCYFLTVVASCGLTARSGASLHYFLEVTALASLFAGLFLSEMTRRLASRPIGQWIPILACLLALTVHLGFRNSRLFHKSQYKGTKAETVDRAMLKLFRNIPGPILSEDAAYEILSRKEPFLINPFIYADLERRGLWDSSPVVSAVVQQKFGAIYLNSDLRQGAGLAVDRMGENILKAIAIHYPRCLPLAKDRVLYFKTQADAEKAAAAPPGPLRP